MANRRIEEQLEKLRALRSAPPSQASAALRQALSDRVNLVAAKAANLAAELNLHDVVPDLCRAFDRFFEDPLKRDPQCWGKNAIAKALKELQHRDAAPFLRGAVHIQLEPVWGGQEDTAGPLRGICLLALPACADIDRPQVLRHLVNALTEPAPPVRADAARALAELQGEDCALLLRLKARAGRRAERRPSPARRSNPARHRTPRGSVPFVASFLGPGDAIAEEAALALSTSRLAPAVDLLLDVWKTARGAEFREAILRALSISRNDAAIAFLEALAAEGRPQDSAGARAQRLAFFPGQ